MKEQLSYLGKEDAKYIIQGAAFLGSGGGGGIEDAYMIADYIFNQVSRIPIKEVNEIRAEETGAVVALMGAPKALKDLKDFSSPCRAFELLQQTKGNKFTYCLPVEVGAVNSLVPMLVAAQLGIAMVDADGAGRAVPQLETTTFAMANISPSPATLVNSITDKFPSYQISISLDKVTLPEGKTEADMLEESARNIINLKDFGQVGGLSTYYTPQSKLQDAVIQNTLRFAYQVGLNIVEGGATGKAVECLTQWFSDNKIEYFTFGEAEVIDVKPASQKQGGFDIGVVKLRDRLGNTLTIDYENENLFAYLNEDPTKIWAIAPDLICYLTPNHALTNVEIAKDQVVTVLGLPCNDKMRNKFITDRFMQILSSLKIYSGEYIPIEKLHERS